MDGSHVQIVKICVAGSGGKIYLNISWNVCIIFVLSTTKVVHMRFYTLYDLLFIMHEMLYIYLQSLFKKL